MRRIVTLFALIAITCAAQAQQRPDAGSTLRETQQPVPLPAKPAAPGLRIDAPDRPALSAPAAAKFQVRTFRIAGNSAFPAASLEELVREFAGRELGLAELQDAAARITRFYRDHGYPVARAYLPAQDVRDGAVEVAVMEGRYGRVELNNRSRVQDEVARRFLAPLQPGNAIEGEPLERSLLLLLDTPGVAAPDSVLRPGAGTG